MHSVFWHYCTDLDPSKQTTGYLLFFHGFCDKMPGKKGRSGRKKKIETILQNAPDEKSLKTTKKGKCGRPFKKQKKTSYEPPNTRRSSSSQEAQPSTSTSAATVPVSRENASNLIKRNSKINKEWDSILGDD